MPEAPVVSYTEKKVSLRKLLLASLTQQKLYANNAAEHKREEDRLFQRTHSRQKKTSLVITAIKSLRRITAWIGLHLCPPWIPVVREQPYEDLSNTQCSTPLNPTYPTPYGGIIFYGSDGRERLQLINEARKTVTRKPYTVLNLSEQELVLPGLLSYLRVPSAGAPQGLSIRIGLRRFNAGYLTITEPKIDLKIIDYKISPDGVPKGIYEANVIPSVAIALQFLRAYTLDDAPIKQIYGGTGAVIVFEGTIDRIKPVNLIKRKGIVHVPEERIQWLERK